ncbi:MAG: hypothetical protein WCO92_01575 [Verrucomicrobiota bacterium]
MLRTQIQFEKETYLTLKKAAKNAQRSISDLVRQSVEQYLQENQKKDAWKKSLASAGSFHSGHTNISANHDQYLGDEW